MTFSTAMLLDKKPAGVVLSASQISRWDLCKRWWAWEYVAGIRSPPHPSAQFGSEVHKHLEAWLRDATPPPAGSKSGQVAARMLRHLPPPGSGVVEQNFFLRSGNGLAYTGFIDWSGFFGGPTIIDHKTTADLRWAKTEADLHNDVQSVLYAVAGCVGFDTDSIQLLWNYGETKGRFAVKAVSTRVHLPLVQEKFERVIEPTAAEIIGHRVAKTDPLSLPPTPSACSAFGGCPHRQRCNLTAQQTFGGFMTGNGQGTMTMAERMAALTGAGAQAPQMQPGQYQPQMQPQQAPQMQYPQPQGAQVTVGGAQVPPQYQQPQQVQYPQQQPQMQLPPVAGQQMAMFPAFQHQPQQNMPMQLPAAMQPAPQVGVATPMASPQEQAPAAEQRPYLPELAPNPPESGRVLTQAPEGGSAADTTEAHEGKKRGRPKGVRNSKKGDGGLTVEQQVFMMGVQTGVTRSQGNSAGLTNDVIFENDRQTLRYYGELALATFRAKFGDDAC